MFRKIDPKMNLPKMEEEILKFWEENKIFEKSVEKEAPQGDYVFYDGPPFATGLPHYGHIVASLMKDTVPRFWTMKGYKVERKWGWDCHGLPIENIAEKELGIKKKKDIEEMGVDKFNEFCRSKVLSYVSEWKKIIPRLGRWADMENSYKTMDLPFMESVWWVFKELYDKGLIYEGHRTMHICTRCETTLSQSEIAEGYKDIKDLSAVVKFELVDEPGTYVLAWTTTPWTLIGNVALAINPDVIYCKIQNAKIKNQNDNSKLKNKEIYIVAKDRVGNFFDEYEVISEFEGKELIGKEYKPLFNYYKDKGLDNEENAAPATPERSDGGRGWKIYSGDFVTTEEGTGVVHIAPAFGEDDAKMGQQYKLPFVQHVGMDGVIKPEAKDFAGLSVKPEKDHQSTDVEIIKYLAKNNLLFAKEKYEHSYPHCWRCDTPLINYATSSWFVSVEKIKKELLENAKNINWVPKHIKEGRFGNWLEAARDWSISRQRYWASVMPIWKCENHETWNMKHETKCNNLKVIGSVKELEDLSGEKIIDLHKHIVDEITFKCEKCDGEMKRIPDVLDTWFDSGSMPYAQAHYPFENKEKFEQSFPAQFIAEGIDQTRCWFYYLHVISGVIKNSEAFRNVVVNGIALAEDGKKMSKRLNNYPDPMEMFNKYGADAVRIYLLSSPVMAAENLNFKESEVAEFVRGLFRMLWNSYSFFVLYANIDGYHGTWNMKHETNNTKNLLDRWITSELNVLIKEVNRYMESYELTRATRLFLPFIDNLSNWYIRRSRKRFWKSESDEDKKEAYETLHYVLITLAKLMAPFAPFIAEEIWRNLVGCHPELVSGSQEMLKQVQHDNKSHSVHLESFPEADENLIDEKLGQKMQAARTLISVGLQQRAQNKIKVRQPLDVAEISEAKYLKLLKEEEELSSIIQEELNVKKIIFKELPDDVEIQLDLNITEDLKLEGQAREIIRYVQEMRKEAGFEVDNRIEIGYSGASSVFQKFGDLIAKETLAESLKSESQRSESSKSEGQRSEGPGEKADLEKEFNIDGEKLKIWVKKV